MMIRGLCLLLMVLCGLRVDAAPIRVLVWDEQQKEQKQVYKNFLGNRIAEALKATGEFEVRTAALRDQGQGITEEVLAQTDVLIWWGHMQNQAISEADGQRIVQRIAEGKLDFIALHSSHWARPFLEAMKYRTQEDARKAYPATNGETVEFEWIAPQEQFSAPRYEDLFTPRMVARKFPEGRTAVKVYMPIACFPAYRDDGKPSEITVLKPEHPIASGVPQRFTIPRTEMYDEAFHVPEPDEVIFEERWATGEWFRSGSLWNIGKGQVFYYRPGHEIYPVFQQVENLQIVVNAVRWLGSD